MQERIGWRRGRRNTGGGGNGIQSEEIEEDGVKGKWMKGVGGGDEKQKLVTELQKKIIRAAEGGCERTADIITQFIC